jgi:hypothetical protein
LHPLTTAIACSAGGLGPDRKPKSSAEPRASFEEGQESIGTWGQGGWHRGSWSHCSPTSLISQSVTGHPCLCWVFAGYTLPQCPWPTCGRGPMAVRAPAPLSHYPVDPQVHPALRVRENISVAFFFGWGCQCLFFFLMCQCFLCDVCPLCSELKALREEDGKSPLGRGHARGLCRASLGPGGGLRGELLHLWVCHSLVTLEGSICISFS